jgi:hypothetical protein
VLALCKFCLVDRQTIEVTISTSFRANALAFSTQRGISRVTGYFFDDQWLDLVCLGRVGVYKIVEEMEMKFGIWSHK